MQCTTQNMTLSHFVWWLHYFSSLYWKFTDIDNSLDHWRLKYTEVQPLGLYHQSPSVNNNLKIPTGRYYIYYYNYKYNYNLRTTAAGPECTWGPIHVGLNKLGVHCTLLTFCGWHTEVLWFDGCWTVFRFRPVLCMIDYFRFKVHHTVQ